MSIKNDVIQFCQCIGREPLLVQGAGGNVSWKDGSVLWVKASGTWLSDAGAQEIFVPVDLIHLNRSLKNENFDVRPTTLGNATLRPSIETMLHALMPHRIVVHLHAVDVLACLVREDAQALLSRLFEGDDSWTWVPYSRPGAP